MQKLEKIDNDKSTFKTFRINQHTNKWGRKDAKWKNRTVERSV